MKELIFNTGGRKLFNDDMQHLQGLIKSFESLYIGEQPFVISGVAITLISGSTYNVSSGYIWLGNRVRQFEGATNVDLATAKFINVRDNNENREYNDAISRVAVTDFGSAFSSTTLGGTNSLRIETSGNVRRYIKDVLGSKMLLLSPESTLQTVSGGIRFTGAMTVEGTVQLNSSLTARAIEGTAINATTSITLTGTTITAINATAALTNSQSSIPSEKVVKTYVDNNVATLTTAINGKAALKDRTLHGFIQMYSGPVSGRFKASGMGENDYGEWAICNGANGTPDLSGMFIVGVGPAYALGATGGANSVTLTAAQSGLPAHTHPISDPGHSHTYWDRFGADQNNTDAGNQTRRVQDTTEAKNTSHNTTGITVQNNTAQNAQAAHENRPPYYALYYIMKVGAGAEGQAQNGGVGDIGA